jgi:hypothetical protein
MAARGKMPSVDAEHKPIGMLYAAGAMRNNEHRLEQLRDDLLMRRGLFVLGAGASAGLVPFGLGFMTAPAIDFVRNGGSFPVERPLHDTRTKKVLKAVRLLGLSDFFPDREIRSGNEDYPFRELAERVSNSHVYYQMAHALASPSYTKRQSDNYRVFRHFRPSLIFNYNLDGLASAQCGTQHRVIDMHGTLNPAYGSPAVRPLLEMAREFDLPLTSENNILCVPEEGSDWALARKLLTAERFDPDFVAVIGYSFGRDGEKFDDALSLDLIEQRFRGFHGRFYVVDPAPERFEVRFSDVLKSRNVIGVRAYWNLFSHALLSAVGGADGGRSLNFTSESLLDRFGDRIAF